MFVPLRVAIDKLPFAEHALHVTSGRLDELLGGKLNPDRSHVYLCGNPAMVGIPHRTEDGAVQYPQPTGMIEILHQRGFRMNEPGNHGNIHFEKYC